MTTPILPHNVSCENETIAKHVRLSVVGGASLHLNEVEVVGTPLYGESTKLVLVVMMVRIFNFTVLCYFLCVFSDE